MGDMYYRLHMKKHGGFGDVAILTKSSYGDTTFKQTSAVPPSDFKNAVLKFKNGGTGFLISTSEIQISGVSKKFGILLTAAHVVCDIANGFPKKSKFRCELNGQSKIAYFLKEYSSTTTAEHRCQTTQSLYCLPGNIALLLVFLDNSSSSVHFEPLDLSLIVKRIECYVSGFPEMPSYPKHCIQMSNQSDKQIKKTAKEIFNRFSGIVFSHGSVVEENETLLEVDCSTTSGMSGSPIISQGRYIGVYVGGPALPGQKELIDVIKSIESGQYINAYHILNSMIMYDLFYKYDIFSEHLRKITIVELFAQIQSGSPLSPMQQLLLEKININPHVKILMFDSFIQFCYDLLYSLVWIYNKKCDYKANVGISLKNQVFRNIENFVGTFSRCGAQIFYTLDELLSFLSFIA